MLGADSISAIVLQEAEIHVSVCLFVCLSLSVCGHSVWFDFFPCLIWIKIHFFPHVQLDQLFCDLHITISHV